MGFLSKQGRGAAAAVQGKRRPTGVWAALPWLAAACGLAGCGSDSPVMTPVGWWHDLVGGQIAADRPPPPGADLPYPHIYTIPPKPVLPTDSYRQTVETQLAQERDDTQRIAAHTPIVVETVPPPPPPPPAPPPAAPPASPSSGVSGAADATQDAQTANATLPGAETPPAPTHAAAASPATADGGPPPGAPLTIAGVPTAEANLPAIPDAPPPPATFEGIPAEPLPSPPPPLPARVARSALGTAVYFAPGSAVLDESQTITIKDAAAHRGKAAIEVEGHGDAASDAPAWQEAALALGLQRAQAIAGALQKQRVPGSAIRISATAFGLGASLRPAS